MPVLRDICKVEASKFRSSTPKSNPEFIEQETKNINLAISSAILFTFLVGGKKN